MRSLTITLSFVVFVLIFLFVVVLIALDLYTISVCSSPRVFYLITHTYILYLGFLVCVLFSMRVLRFPWGIVLCHFRYYIMWILWACRHLITTWLYLSSPLSRTVLTHKACCCSLNSYIDCDVISFVKYTRKIREVGPYKYCMYVVNKHATNNVVWSKN